MQRIPRFTERSLYTWSRRAGFLLRRFALNRFVRLKNARTIELNGRKYKRVTLPDSFVAARVDQDVGVFRDFEILPKIVAIDDNELLVEFVEGRPVPEAPDAALAEQLAAFFATLYGVERKQVKLVDTRFESQLRDDLAFLTDVRVLDSSATRGLEAAIDRIAPNEVWTGYDFLDALSKNFIIRPDGRLLAVDVEDLMRDQLLGSGVAKALIRGWAPHRDTLLDQLANRSGFDLRPLMPFVEMCFTAAWTKHAFLKGRHKLVDPRRFDAFRAD